MSRLLALLLFAMPCCVAGPTPHPATEDEVPAILGENPGAGGQDAAAAPDDMDLEATDGAIDAGPTDGGDAAQDGDTTDDVGPDDTAGADTAVD